MDVTILTELKKRLREADERRERIPEQCWCYRRPSPWLEYFEVDGRTVYLVECPRCGFKAGSFNGFTEAVKAWNSKIQQHYTESENA